MYTQYRTKHMYTHTYIYTHKHVHSKGPRFSSTTWFGSCEGDSEDCVDEASILTEEAEEEGGGLLGGPLKRKHRKKPSIARRLSNKVVPCCFIQ
jgi:2-iminoacetate synthase ThiH